MELTANKILEENNIQFKRIGYCKWVLIFNNKTIIRPDNPKDCYELLIKEFGITEPRLKYFK